MSFSGARFLLWKILGNASSDFLRQQGLQCTTVFGCFLNGCDALLLLVFSVIFRTGMEFTGISFFPYFRDASMRKTVTVFEKELY